MGKLQRLDKILATILSQAPANVFVETGTFHGESLDFARTLPFERLHSVELSKELHEAATVRFADDARVVLHHGDSAEILPRILRQIEEPAVFWLDAHYCLLDSARGTKDSPLLEEIAAIAAHEAAARVAHTVLIDDHHIFGTTPSSPWLVGEDVAFVPEADWGEVTDEKVRDMFGIGKQYHAWADTLFVLPPHITTADIEVPHNPYAAALPVAPDGECCARRC
jgi:hypothetical protein